MINLFIIIAHLSVMDFVSESRGRDRSQEKNTSSRVLSSQWSVQQVASSISQSQFVAFVTTSAHRSPLKLLHGNGVCELVV